MPDNRRKDKCGPEESTKRLSLTGDEAEDLIFQAIDTSSDEPEPLVKLLPLAV
ncbi:MAG TPA: hypothetical protein VEZ90_17975 [Blastocatellia bacterium]|nr:hypothetical protein [Blastocatellia bacterium]